MACDVFEEDPFKARAKFAGDAGDIRPEVALVVGPLALPGIAERLTGVSGQKRVETSCEGFGVDLGEVIPDRGGSKISGPLGCDEAGSLVFLPLDKGAGVEAWLGEHEAHIQACAACAEG